MTLRAEAEVLLGRLTGRADAAFRDGQFEAIERLVEGRGRVLVVQRTGWGKSAVYFVATRLLRDRGAGPTVLVSPLLALMRNQIAAAERAGVRAVTINSENRDDWDGIEAQVKDGDIDVLLISPERLNNVRFRREVLPDLVGTIGLLVVDEAHCISDWGHDFRPDYRRIRTVIADLPPGVPVLCTTATANDRVVEDVVEQLGDDLEVYRGPLDRESLSLAAVDLPDPAARLAWLSAVVPTLPGSGIVYCLTVADTERVAGWLRSQGIDAVAYSGGTDSGDRVGSEAALLDNRVKVVVATSALGMGFDKPDLTFVIHFQTPGSPIAYYQQVGRAGRGVDEAHGVLLRGVEDTDIQDWFIRTAFPPREKAEKILEVLALADAPVGMAELERQVNARRTRIEGMLKVLEVEGAVERAATGSGWVRTAEPWMYDDDRVERVTALRRTEQAAMEEYGRTGGCRMAFLRRQLDDTGPGALDPCGRCDNCTGRRWDRDLDPALVASARAHLRGAEHVVEPRRQWPAGMGAPKGRIPADRQVEIGRALGVRGDGGWGGVVDRALRMRSFVPDELIDALERIVRDWRPAPAPTWVTWIPSTSAPEVVADVAARIAARLDLPLHEALSRTGRRRPQREMENSAQQVRNVGGAFEVTADAPTGPVLLVDDIVDSRWTMTIAGEALRERGVEAVHPLVLARTTGG